MALLEIDDFFMRDERFPLLGELTKTGRHDVRSRVLSLWFDCILQTKDVRTAEEIDILTGWLNTEIGSFADLMVKAKLAEPAEGGYRIRGVKERMQWLVDYRQKRRDLSIQGGKARVNQAKRDGGGKFAAPDNQPQPADDQPGPAVNQPQAGGNQPCTSQTPAGDQPAAGCNQPAPAPSVPCPCSLIPDSAPDAVTEIFTAAPLSQKPAAKAPSPGRRQRSPAKSAAVFEAFTRAYTTRYKFDPGDNATMRSQMCKFIDLVGAENAPQIAAFFVTHNHRKYTDRKHDFGLALIDWQKLRTEWLQGRQATEGEARQTDAKQTNYNAFQPLLTEAEQREAETHGEQ